MAIYATAAYATVPRSFAFSGPSSFAPCRIDILGSSAIPGWSIRQPITVTIERSEEGHFIVSDDLFHLYGVADTISAAVRDYFAVLTEYYDHLANPVDEADEALFEYLRTYLRPE